MRNYYVNHSLNDTYEKYGSRNSSKEGFRSVIDKSYSYLPKYSKTKKQWLLNNKVIDINKYNPVSTILESEE